MSGWTVASVLLVVLSFVTGVWIWGAALVALLALAATQWWLGERTFELSGIEGVDSMSGREFERWLGRFYERLGFTVELTPYSGDFGADLIVVWNGMRVAVQAKSGHVRAGVAAVQQVCAARAFYNCERAVVVSSQYFTTEAILLAEANGIELRNRDDLARKLAEIR
jgi:HJR/Mrr/RecB family endonuclease